jgi:23S rRNA (cytosine1962-C5)-methyltransferase
MVSRIPGERLEAGLLSRRLEEALALRKRLFRKPFYRLVFGESDGLPGLIVDRYDQVLVAQIGTAGMEQLRHDLITALDQLLHPLAIVLRNDIPGRVLEGLPSYVEIPFGKVPDELELEENGAHFAVHPVHGQKTGWYFDHRLNRRRLSDYTSGTRVLDLFSYSGAWGIQAAVAGARQVVCVDSSASALDQVVQNAARNGAGAKVEVLHEEAFRALKALHAEGRRFDLIIADPPAFIPRRKDLQAGIEAYRRLNRLAMRLLGPDGILISASCSAHLSREKLMDILKSAARAVGREFRILEEGHQAPDHPVHPALPETAYLKVFFLRVY